MRVAVLAALCAVAAGAQTQSRVFSYAADATPQNVQEIVNAVRTITDIDQIYIEDQARTFVAKGTADQLALAAWLVEWLQTEGGNGVQQYTIPGTADDPRRGFGNQVRIFYVAGLPNPQAMQELVNALRVVVDAPKVYQYWKSHAIAMRLTPDQAALSEWVVGALTRPAGAAGKAEFTATGMMPADTVATRVYYQPGAVSAAELQETVVAVRASAGVKRIYAVFFPRAIILRGTPEQASAADGLMAKH